MPFCCRGGLEPLGAELGSWEGSQDRGRRCRRRVYVNVGGCVYLPTLGLCPVFFAPGWWMWRAQGLRTTAQAEVVDEIRAHA